ncbi:PREDICTED: uncharacterized protein LOC109326403 [Lupinus angustifolius]|uniref:uncharacterized protein LOC109326403 n=1 Tax=Lupinus angustifolius TaxID=3871 RepID=UPI00092E6182|nr:PREDICTED: uncharacterized protein LOC109326403 [Lupinus angustifolius]
MVYEGNGEQNQILGASSIEGQGSTIYQPSTLPSNLTGQQASRSRNIGPLGLTITDGTSSQARVSEIAGLLRSARMIYEGNDVQSQILGASNIQGQSSAIYQPSTLSSNLIGQQANRSRNIGPLGITITDGTSSQPPMSETAGLLRPERASSLQLQQVPPVSSKRPTMWKNWKGKNGEEYEPPRRGRPRKRFEVGESSSRPKHRKTEQKDSRGTENGTTHAPEEANNTPENLRNEVQISNPTNPSHAATNPREFSTGLYGQNQTSERNGVSTDPLLRLFKPSPEK